MSRHVDAGIFSTPGPLKPQAQANKAVYYQPCLPRIATAETAERYTLFCSAEWLWCSYLTSHGVQNRASMSAGTPGLQRSFKLSAALLDQALRRSLIGF